jgi:ribonuclease H2 subunit A
MADTVMEEPVLDTQELALETPTDGVFRPPSIDKEKLVNGVSYSYFSKIPETVRQDMSTECCLGVDEAGRGPVLGMRPLFTLSTQV